MTAIEDARATAEELDRRVDACDLMDAWNLMASARDVLRALITEHERMTAPPTDDERAHAISAVHAAWEARQRAFDGTGLAQSAVDAILAAGFRRREQIGGDTEWGVAYRQGDGSLVVDNAANRQDAEEEVALSSMHVFVVSRHVGPWEPVEAAENAR